jgi:hypothetical protein
LINYLFDDYYSTKLIVKNKASLYRINNNIQIKEYDIRNENENNQLLFKMDYKNGKYYFKSNNLNNDNKLYKNLPWFVYRNDKNIKEKQYKISEGDIIKIGNLILKIRCIHLKNSLSKTNSKSLTMNTFNENLVIIRDNLKDQETNRLKSNDMLKIKSNESMYTNNKNKRNKICRICYLNEFETEYKDNPLIKPCKCSGTMKYIHIKCLLQWLKAKNKIENDEENKNITILSLNDVYCELCNIKFPEYIRHKGKIYNLIDVEQYENKDENYLIIDKIYNLDIENEDENYRCIIKFNENDNNIKIGNGVENDLIIVDDSIDLNHCFFNLKVNGEVYLNDCNSKFGTLVLIQNESLEILPNQTLRIQIGRIYFNIKLKKSCSFICCCEANEKTGKTYEKMNKTKIIYKNMDYINSKIYIDEDSDDDNDNKENENAQLIIDKYKENLPYLNIKKIDNNSSEKINDKYKNNN